MSPTVSNQGHCATLLARSDCGVFCYVRINVGCEFSDLGLSNLGLSGVDMQRVTRVFILLCGVSMVCLPFVSEADDTVPWGMAKVLDINYKPSKVLYDLTSGNKEEITSLLDRVGYLNKIYNSDTFDASIVVVVHGNAIPFFAIKEFKKNKNIMVRAQSLTVGTSIEFRMCRAAAKLLNYEPTDIHGFVKMVPMADAEIIRLQGNGYAYMR